MKHPLGIAVLAVALATSASAGESKTMAAAVDGVSPDFCPALQTLLGAARGSFVSLHGKARAGEENVWEGTKKLPGASDCRVFGGTPAAYVCTVYAGDVEENADGAYDRAVSGVKVCLPADAKTTERVDGVHARTTTAGGSDRPRVRVVSRDASGDAYLVEVWVEAPER